MDEQDVTLDNIDQDIFTDSTEDIENNIESRDIRNDGIRLLFSGDALDEADLYKLSARKKTSVIYILGPVGSGKTTFETMLYKCFLKSVDDELLFAGSETLSGYEERLNNHRVKSGNAEISMGRTNVEERRYFLHLNVNNIKQNKDYSVVFSDISGEIFERCVSNVETLEADLKNLDMAGKIVVFMDGSLLLDKKQRHNVVSKTKLFLVTLKSSSFYSANCNIDIIITKNDIIYEKTKKQEDSFISNIESRFDDLKKYYNINIIKVEAQSGENIKDTENSTPLLVVLKRWLSDIDLNEYVEENKEQNHIFNSNFNRFGEVY